MSDRKPNVLLLGENAALTTKVLYCTYPVANVILHALSDSHRTANSRYLSGRVFADLSVDAINSAIKAHDIDVVLPADMNASEWFAEHGEQIHGAAIFPCMDASTINALDDKWIFAEKLMAAGIPTPHTVLIDDKNRYDVSSLSFPMIVKPLFGESSHGVVKIESMEALDKHIKNGGKYAEPPLIAQQYIDGPDVDISILADQGKILASAVQRWTPDGCLVFEEHPPMDEIAQNIAELYTMSGAAHFDMRKDQKTGDYYVIECNPRFWFSLPASMWCGLNFVERGLEMAMGKPLSNDRASGRYWPPGEVVASWKRPGRLFSISANNWRGFFQPILDPKPHFMKNNS